MKKSSYALSNNSKRNFSSLVSKSIQNPPCSQLFNYKETHLPLEASNGIIHKSALTFSPVAASFFPNLYQFIANRTTGISFIVYEEVIICLVY